MAYRRPTSEHDERGHRLQTLAGQIAGMFLLFLMLGLAFLFADWTVPPQHLPWKPLRLSDPVGVATQSKVAQASVDAELCRRVLAKGGVSFQDVPDRQEGFCAIKGGLIVTGGLPTPRPAGAVMMCQQALAYSLWMRQVVQPAARELLGAEVASVDQYGAYVCRRIYGSPSESDRVSQHAYANALDVGGFRLTDGRSITVEKGWKGAPEEAAFLRRVRDGACGVFRGVLSPDYNAAHYNHLHLDMGPYQMCR
jgi:hypothetical protein